jgi:hypothetical protein
MNTALRTVLPASSFTALLSAIRIFPYWSMPGLADQNFVICPSARSAWPAMRFTSASERPSFPVGSPTMKWAVSSAAWAFCAAPNKDGTTSSNARA